MKIAKQSAFWKSTLEDIDQGVESLKRGGIAMRSQSAGGRPVYLIEYGQRNDHLRTANLSSALGAKDIKCYADKTQPGYRPTLLLVGGIHGGEFEGTVALLNLIQILETGKDFLGRKQEFLQNSPEDCNLLIVPCANPDGRKRIPFDSFVGRSFEDLRYYNQGTWKDGSLCNWPDCKKVHPILDWVNYLGGYFNDDGVNMMHDNFFGNKAKETAFLLEIAETFAPDFTVLLHGGSNTVNCILKPAYAPQYAKERILQLEEQIKKHCHQKKLPYQITALDRGENKNPPASFNLTSAIYHICGCPCVTYESNQGLSYGETILTQEEIYQEHLILFEETIRFILNGGEDNAH